MEIKKNDVFFTTIEDMSDDGAGIGKTDGYTWFIKDTVIGDVVEAAAMKMKKSYGYGWWSLPQPGWNRHVPWPGSAEAVSSRP